MKKLLLITLAAMMLFCTACGTSQTNSDTTAESTESADASEATQSEGDVLETEEGTLKFIGIEKTNDTILTENIPNVWIFKYEFTNKTPEPKQCQNFFEIKTFQNNVETKDFSSSWSSEGGDQYDLISNYYLEALKGGTITFGLFVQLEDESDVTVFLNDKNSDKSTSFTVEIKEDVPQTSDADAVSADKVYEDLLGEWKSAPGKDEGILTFTADNVTLTVGNLTMAGTYEIIAEESYVQAEFASSDNKLVKVKFHYKYENDKLVILNDAGEDTFIKE